MECLSHPDRGRRGPAKRRRMRQARTTRSRWKSDACWRRFVPTFPVEATFTAATTPTNADLGTVTVSQNTTGDGDRLTPAPITSVAELTPNTSFGGDIVRIKAGSRRRLRQRALRHLPRRRRQHRRDQPARRDLPGRSGHGQGQRVLRPEHGHEPARPQRAVHRRQEPRGQLAGRLDRAT